MGVWEREERERGRELKEITTESFSNLCRQISRLRKPIGPQIEHKEGYTKKHHS